MTTNPNGFMVVQNSTDESQRLGKFMYYSLAHALVPKEDFDHRTNGFFIYRLVGSLALSMHRHLCIFRHLLP